MSSASGFDGIDVTDQIGNRYIGCCQLFHVALFVE